MFPQICCFAWNWIHFNLRACQTLTCSKIEKYSISSKTTNLWEHQDSPVSNGWRSKAQKCIPSSPNLESECNQIMDSVDSKLSVYTALSVITLFATTTFFICWKLRLSKGKESAGYICSELPTLVPCRSSLKQTHTEQWQPKAPSVDAVVARFCRKQE